MIAEIQNLTGQYLDWLRDNTEYREFDEWTEITTPFLDRHNDCIQIHAKPMTGGYMLTDRGYTIDDLEFCGFNLNSERRRDLLNITLNGFGVSKVNNELQVKATAENFPLRKLNLLQAMLAVNDMHVLASPIVASAFADDVARWLKESEIVCERNVPMPGKSGLNVRYDFVIRHSGNRQDHVLWTIGNPDLDSAKRTVFAWLDTMESNGSLYKPFALIDDLRKPVSEQVTKILSTYEIQPLRFSAPEKALKHLRDAA